MNYGVKIHNDIVTFTARIGTRCTHKEAAMANIKIAQYLETPSEVAELASMMLATFNNGLLGRILLQSGRSKKQTSDCTGDIAFFLGDTVDALQHWVGFTSRTVALAKDMMPLLILVKRFPREYLTGLENYRKILWTQQLHILSCLSII